ncbi:MAG: hypothetical protein JWQ98_828 [Chlorobi bacterium]|nr:hypothetical protein [Chlorobiota bacterium]
MVPQWRTVEILRDRLTELGGRVELGTGLTNLAPDNDGVVATLSNPDGTEQVRAGYVVGADGGRSFVRKSLGVNFLGESMDSDRSIIADVQAEGPDREHRHMWLNPAAPANRVALCPLPATRVFQYVAPITTEDTPELTLASLQRIFDERSGTTGVRLSELSWATIYRANIRMADTFRVGRVFLAGDAAHMHSPAGGQGLNTGIQDACNLGSWERRAMPGNLLAGDRAPDAFCHRRGKPVRLFDVFRGPHFTLPAFGEKSAALVAGISEKHGESARAFIVDDSETAGGDNALFDITGDIREGYGIHGDAIVLIRPDGYIGYFSDEDNSGVNDYLKMVLP